MSDQQLTAFESFLVEDVILTLGNLRSSLDWMRGGRTDAEAEQNRAGIDRLDRQLGLLQERAHDVCRQLRSVGAERERSCAPVAARDADTDTDADGDLVQTLPTVHSASASSNARSNEATKVDLSTLEAAVLTMLRANGQEDQADTAVFRSQRG